MALPRHPAGRHQHDAVPGGQPVTVPDPGEDAFGLGLPQPVLKVADVQTVQNRTNPARGNAGVEQRLPDRGRDRDHLHHPRRSAAMRCASRRRARQSRAWVWCLPWAIFLS